MKQQEVILDSYGNAALANRSRLRGCKCKVPCPAFLCVAPEHNGERDTPWCCGSDSNDRGLVNRVKTIDIGRCDDCACIAFPDAKGIYE